MQSYITQIVGCIDVWICKGVPILVSDAGYEVDRLALHKLDIV